MVITRKEMSAYFEFDKHQFAYFLKSLKWAKLINPIKLGSVERYKQQEVVNISNIVKTINNDEYIKNGRVNHIELINCIKIKIS